MARKSEALRLASVETDDFASFETKISTKIQGLEADASRIAVEIDDADRGLRALEAELASTRERIAAEESGVEYQTAQIREWRAESTRTATQERAIVARLAADAQAAQETERELAKAKESAKRIETDFENENVAGEKLVTLAATLVATRDKLQRERETSVGETTRFASEISALKTRKATLAAATRKARQKNATHAPTDGASSRQTNGRRRTSSAQRNVARRLSSRDRDAFKRDLRPSAEFPRSNASATDERATLLNVPTQVRPAPAFAIRSAMKTRRVRSTSPMVSS